MVAECVTLALELGVVQPEQDGILGRSKFLSRDDLKSVNKPVGVRSLIESFRVEDRAARCCQKKGCFRE